MPPPSAPGVPPSQASSASAAATGTGATKGSSGVREPEMFSLEDAEATVETLLLMEFADLGTLDQTVTSGRLKGDMVRAYAVSLQTGCSLSPQKYPRKRQYALLPMTQDVHTWSQHAGPRHSSMLTLAAGVEGSLIAPVRTAVLHFWLPGRPCSAGDQQDSCAPCQS